MLNEAGRYDVLDVGVRQVERGQRRWWQGLRAKLVICVLVAVLPLSGLLSLLWVGARQRDREDTLDSLRQTAQAIAVVADDTFDDGITLARAIALDPPVQSLDAAQLGSRLRAFRAVYPQIQTIVVAGMNGTVLGWSADERLPDPAPSIADRPFLARVTQTGQPTTIRVVNTEGPLAFSTGVAAPISTADGATVGVVAVILKLESIGSRLTEIRLFPGQVLTLIDPNGRVALFVGINGVTSVEVPWEQRDRSALPEVQAALGGEEVTSATYRGVRTGQERLGAFVPTPRHGWVVGATWPVAQALATTRQAEQRELVIFLAIVMILVLAVLVASRSLITPLQRLSAYAQQLGNINFAPIADVRSNDEIGDLATSLSVMGQQLQGTLGRLREREEVLSALINQFPGSVVVIDRDYRYVMAAGQQLTNLGLRPEDLVGRLVTEIFPSDVLDWSEPYRQRAFEGETVTYDTTTAGRLLQVTDTPLRNAAGEVEHVMALAIDVTEERAQLERAARDEKLRVLGQMAGGIAHDLNQALALVAGYSDLADEALSRDPIERSSLREMIRIMGQAAYDGGETVKRLLMFARGETNEHHQTIDVAVLLHEVEQLTVPRWRESSRAEGRPIDLRVEVSPGPTISGSRSSLREALTNLVFNALDAMPAGGTITLTARRSGDQVLIDVTDTGVGMPPDVKARVFEPFFTTKGERGTGLGLAMVFSIVQRHGGQIDVTSEPDRGTTVRLQFPFADAGTDDLSDAAVGRAALLLRVLVVDDEPRIAQLLGAMLRRDGHHAVTVLSTREALVRLRIEPFDLVITDLSMGEGMNGWELATRIHQTYRELPVILATGWGAGIDEDEARARGVRAVLPKPYAIASLRAAITRATSD